MAVADCPRPSRAMDPDEDCGYQVELFIYELSGGLAQVISPHLLGKSLDGVWHTGVVVYGREYFFGSGGIESCKPGGTILGDPHRIESLGESQVPYQLFLEYIFGLGESSYKPGAYDLFKHNCNNFSDELAQFLCGRGIPKAILQLPDEVLNTPVGKTLNEALQKVELKHSNSRSINFGPLNNSALGPALQVVRTSYDDPEFDELNDAIDQVRHNSLILEERRNSLNDKLSKKERKEKRREKRERKEKRRKEKLGDSYEEKRHKKKSKPPLPPSSSSPSTFDHNSDSQSPQLQSRKYSATDSTLQNGRLDSEERKAADPSLSLNPVSDHSDNAATSEVSGGAAEEETSDWQPVDDFWGSNNDEDCPQESQSHSTSNTAAIETIEPPSEFSDSAAAVVGSGIEQSGEQQQSTDMEEEAAPQPPMEEGAPAPPAQRPPIQIQDDEPEVPREPPILFKEHTDGRKDFDELVGCCMNMLSNEEQQHMEELRSYAVEDDGAWALGENFGDIFARIFHDPNIPDQARNYLVRVLAVAALKDDVILLLHQDRKDHSIMNFANKVEHLPPYLQESIALFFCNMFEHLSPSEWLLYISEWSPVEGSQPISNIRVTTKVAVNALLHSDSKIQDYGTALMYNLGTKEVKTVVFDDVAPELAMAILQFLSSSPAEELLWRCLTALCRFCYASTEVPSLIKMIGPEPNTFQGKSERIDSVIEELNAKLSRVRLF